MSNFLQDALQALDDEELERFMGCSTLRGNFESSILGGKLQGLINRAHQADNACMHATAAFTKATLQASLKDMILLAGTDVAVTGIVKDDSQHPCDTHTW